jgi:hypothetical protein
MNGSSEYQHMLSHLYEKSLVLHDTSLFHPVLYFYYIDALAHIDYTLGVMSYSYQSPKTILAGEYLRWRIDEEKKGERVHFPPFIPWLKSRYPETFGKLPLLWRRVYDREDPAEYRSFRIVLDPESNQPIPPAIFYRMIEDFFDQEFLKSLYEDASLSRKFHEYLSSKTS